MSRKFLTPINLVQNELQNARIQNLSSAPSSPVTGQIYYNTSSNALYVYNGTAWGQAGGITSGTLSARPTASSVSAGTFYYATDNYLIYYSNGSTWQQVDNFGSGQTTANSVTASSSDGTSTNYARADHTHAGEGFGSVTAQTSFGQGSSNGTASTVAHSDHTHGTPSLGSTTPNAVNGTTGSAGSASTASASDHTHAFSPSSFTLDTFGAPVASVSLNSQKITNLATPTASTDAASKGYVDGVAQGLNVKGSVVAATTASITLVGGQTIDGVTITAGQRVLVKNQSTPSQNGIYVAQTTTWTRAADQQTPTQGDFTFVEQGTVNGSQGWILATGTTTWTQFSAAGEYTAGNGITITGSSIAFNPTSTGGLQTASGGASILLATNSGLGTSSSGLAVGAGTGITVSTGTVAIDGTVVVKKYATAFGDGSSTSYTITHNLGTQDVTVAVYNAASPYDEVMCDVQHTSTSAITLLFSTAPTSNQYRVVVHG